MRRISLLVLFLFIMQTITSGIGMNAEINTDNKKSSFFENITIMDEAGEEVNLSKEHQEDINVSVSVNWSIEADGIAGETKIMELPEKLEVDEEQTGNLTDGNKVVGVFTVSTDGVLEVVINGDLFVESEMSGSIDFRAVLEGNAVEKEPNEKIDITENKNGDRETEESIDNSENGITEDKTLPSQRKIKPFFNGSKSEITENIITDVKLSVREGEGGEYKEQVSETEIVVDDPFDKFKVKLDYEFALPNNHGYGAGSTYTIEIPDVFSVLANPEPTPLKNESGIEFATFIVTNDNKIEIGRASCRKEYKTSVEVS